VWYVSVSVRQAEEDNLWSKDRGGVRMWRRGYFFLVEGEEWRVSSGVLVLRDSLPHAWSVSSMHTHLFSGALHSVCKQQTPSFYFWAG
jgi:hypothetical protein